MSKTSTIKLRTSTTVQNGFIPKSKRSNTSPAEQKRQQLDEAVAQELARLPALERGALQVLWTDLFGTAPNPKLRRELLILILTYRIQERAYGGLKPATHNKLMSHLEGFAKNKEVSSNMMRAARPGTRIVREWGSKLHEVAVVDSGYEYDGKRYRSLSEIARQITGTRWSGPAFFGLKKRSQRVTA